MKAPVHLEEASRMSLFSSFIIVAKGGSSLIFTFFNLPSGVVLTFKAEVLLLPLAGAEDGLFIIIPFEASALNVDFDFNIDLIVFGPKTGSAPSNFSSGGRGVFETRIHSVISSSSR
ncbi:hypothetical protein Tco_0488180 [Tanacetum coccineum]